MINWMKNASELSQVELIWLLVWNIAAGNWDGVGLPPEKAHEFFVDFVGKLDGDPLVAAENSRTQLQRALMASRHVPIEEIRRKPPFDSRARHNLEVLLTAWKNEGQLGLARAWHSIFSVPVDWPSGSDRAQAAVAEHAADSKGLSDIELSWLIAWNAAAGAWDRIGLSEDEAKQVLLQFMQCMLGDRDQLKAVEESRTWLRQSLMALRRGSFEEIQGEAPFSSDAASKFKELVRAWQDRGEEGVTLIWKDIFAPGWQEKKQSQLPIKVIGGPGDSQEHALQVLGTPDRETAVAAEWWYLYYTYGRGWKWQMHATVAGKAGHGHFSLHKIRLLPNRREHIYFRLPW